MTNNGPLSNPSYGALKRGATGLDMRSHTFIHALLRYWAERVKIAIEENGCLNQIKRNLQNYTLKSLREKRYQKS